MDETNIVLGIKCCIGVDGLGCMDCPYDKDENGVPRRTSECKPLLYVDFENLYSDMKNVIKLLTEADEA